MPPSPAQPDPCRQEPSAKTLDAYAGYLRACPSTPKRPDMLEAMSRLIEKKNDAYERYRNFVDEFPDGMPFVPPFYLLGMVGPEGMRVHDCVEALKKGVDAGVLLEQVRRKHGIYEDFTFEEIDILKQMGLPSDIIQAMIESTLEAKQEDQTRERKKTAEQQYLYQAPVPSPGGESLQPAVDAVQNCAAQAAAREACKRLSGFAKSLCDTTAQAQFPCP